MLRFLPAIVLVVSCSTTSISYPSDDDLVEDVLLAQDLWAIHSIHDYRFLYQSSGFACGTPPISITVRNSSVYSARFAETRRDCQGLMQFKKGRDASYEFPNSAVTVDDLFKEVHRLAEIGTIDAKYHPIYGFPVIIRFNNFELEDDLAIIYVRSFEFF